MRHLQRNSDPNTKKFLRLSVEPVFGFCSLVRSSWKTASSIVEKRCVPDSWEDDEEEGKPQSKKMSGWLQPKELSEAAPKKNAYFKERHISNVINF